MTITHKIKIDLTTPKERPFIRVMQGDAYSRCVEISLLDDGTPWMIPDNAVAVIRYCRGDGVSGAYGSLPDGSAAYTVTGNVLALTLIPQVCAVPGGGSLTVALLEGDEELNTFAITLKVSCNPGLGAGEAEEYENDPTTADRVAILEAGYSRLLTDVIKRQQLTPEFANTIDECADTGKLYVLPDGYIYAYLYDRESDTCAWASTGVGFGGPAGVGITSIIAEHSNLMNATLVQIKMSDDTGVVFTVPDGSNGEDGKSAYEYATEAGYTGSEEEFAEKLAESVAEKEFQATIGETNLTIPGWNDGAYIHIDAGSVIANENFSYSDYIQINGFASLDIYTHINSSSIAVAIAFYDINKSIVSLIHPDGCGDVTVAYNVAVPDRAVYARVSCKIETTSLVKVIGRDFLSPVREVEDYSYITPVWNVGGYIKQASGGFVSLAIYSYSDYIRVAPGNKIYACVYAAADVSGYAFYDDSKNFISGGSVCVRATRSWQAGVIEAPENAAYFRISHIPEGGEAKIAIIPAGKNYHALLTEVKELNADVQGLETSLEAVGRTKSTYHYALEKVLCIGDSLTSGAYYASDWAGASIDQNYPRFLGRMLNATVTNAGKSGYSASDWVNANFARTV